MLTYSMTLSPMQKGNEMARRSNGAILPDTTGETALCENMRERISGQLEAVGDAATIASLSSTVVCSDKRGNKEYLFSLTSNNKLMLEGELQSNHRYTAINQYLATLDSRVKMSASVGEFLILLLSDGTLWYLLWNSDLETYTPLGRLPKMPRIEVCKVQTMEYPATVSATNFGKTIDDLREEIPLEACKKCHEAILNGWRRCEQEAHASGRWTQPVSVRFAIRLWDGRILHVSTPQIVSFDSGFQCPSRLLLPLEGNTDGFTGTSATTMSLEGFKIGVSVDKDWEVGEWKDVIRGIEVWLSPMTDVIDENGEFMLSAYSTSTANYLSGMLPMKPTDKLIDSICTTGYYRHSLLTSDMLPEVELSYDATAANHITELSSLVTDSFLELRAKTILGHGDFLHIGNVSRRFPTPTVHSYGNEGVSIPCIVSVDICSPFGLRHVSTSTTLSSTRLSPLLSYADKDAVRMEIKMLCDEGVRYGSFILKSNGKENESIYAEESLLPIELPLDNSEDFTIAEDVGNIESHPSAIITTERGNPFVAKSITRNSGGEINALAAQSCGGGAYTRQFIYLFTHRGIMALTHKPEGEHTNCRMIASDVVDVFKKICTTADGVYAISISGDLIRLNDSRRLTLFGGLNGAAALAWNRAKQELWIVPNPSASNSWQRSIVVQLTKNFRVWLSTTIPYNLLNNSGEPLFIDSGVVAPINTTYFGVLKTLAQENSPTGNQIWVSSAIDNPKRGLIIGRIGIFGEDVDAGVNVKIISDGEKLLERNNNSLILDEFHVTGDFTSPVETHFIVGNHQHEKKQKSSLLPKRELFYSSKLQFSIQGHIPQLKGISLV